MLEDDVDDGCYEEDDQQESPYPTLLVLNLINVCFKSNTSEEDRLKVLLMHGLIARCKVGKDRYILETHSGRALEVIRELKNLDEILFVKFLVSTGDRYAD